MLTQSEYDENYYNGGGYIGGYTLYSDTTYYHETSEQLANKFLNKSRSIGVDLINKKVLVVGCAYGYLVQYLINLGIDAYGMDFSSYAISRVPEIINSKVILGDVRIEEDFIKVKNLAGLTNADDKFDLIIDEDMIVCLTDSEAITFRTLALKYSNMFIHLIDITPSMIQWYNYHSIAEWKAILGTSPNEKWYTRFNWLEE